MVPFPESPQPQTRREKREGEKKEVGERERESLEGALRFSATDFIGEVKAPFLLLANGSIARIFYLSSSLSLSLSLQCLYYIPYKIFIPPFDVLSPSLKGREREPRVG